MDINEIIRRQGNAIASLKNELKAAQELTAEQGHNLAQQKAALKQAQKWIKRASRAIKYIEDIPGKRVPYNLTLPLDLPIPVALAPNGEVQAFSIAGQELNATQNVSMDGPFVCTSYQAAFELRTYSLGPTEARPADEPAGTLVRTPLSGRMRPIASTADDFSGAYIGPGSPIGITAVNTMRPGAADFLWAIQDQGTDRQRQNMPVPSRYLYSERDRPAYLPVSDFFERGSVIKVSVVPTRDLGTVEQSYVPYNGVQEGQGEPITGEDTDRRVFALGGRLYFTLQGYKILQAQSPAV